MVMRLCSIAIGIAALIGEQGPPSASAEPCPCASNSPVINPFPFKWIRWGTSRVLQGTSRCPIAHAREPAIAISEIEQAESKSGDVRGYQLIVVDLAINHLLCKGTKLAGVQFVLSEGQETVMIQQVAKTKITPDEADLDKSRPDEYRVVYALSAVKRPNDSICTHALRSGGWFRRSLRRLFGYETVAYEPSQPSDLTAQPDLDGLAEVLPDHLADYAVIIPNAEYNDNVVPQTPPSEGLPELHIPPEYDSNGHPTPRPGWKPSDKSPLEWFEYACASGALAHTELRGLLDARKEPQTVRTAALRMFSATYKGETAETIFGVPISFMRISDSSSHDDPCPALGPHSFIEARWDDKGATCLSHSRLWMKDTVITAAHNPDLVKSEDDFTFEFCLPSCERPDELPPAAKCGKPARPPRRRIPRFTSCVVNHIDHPPTGSSRP